MPSLLEVDNVGNNLLESFDIVGSSNVVPEASYVVREDVVTIAILGYRNVSVGLLGGINIVINRTLAL